MPFPDRLAPPRTFQAALLASVSALTLLAAGSPARATALLAHPATAPVTTATASIAAGAQQAAVMAQQSMASLARATQAIQAMLAAQSAARNLVLTAPSTVPDGLVAGGLVPDSGLASSGAANPVSTWTSANTPVQSTSNGQTLVTVQQTAQKAILNWTSFNIGKNTELYINQSQGTAADGSNNWVALNHISDPSGVPSQILGSIKAEGSVYVINPNGIIFGGSSQISVDTLIASSLNLFSNTFGDANTPGTTVYRFLNGGIGDLNQSNFQTSGILLTTTQPGAGNITIAPGASIAVGNQGFAVIAAPNVSNNGVITASSGQVALIAGIGVSYDYNATSFNAAENSPTSTANNQGLNNNATTVLRFANYGTLTDAQGNDITPIGTLVNNGLIVTPRGNITLLGGSVQQNGVAVATTSVAQPGSIVIESLYEVGRGTPYPADESDTTFFTGPVTFGPQAVTAILPDGNGVTLPSDAKSLAPFQSVPSGAGFFTTPLPTQGFGVVEVIGQAIDFQGGSLTYAPGQSIAASAIALPDPRIAVPGAGRIFVENGAVLDVSGIPDTVLPASANLLTVKLAGNELADDPMQQNGFLYGQSVTVDMRLTGTNAQTGESWVGTPLANLSSYANLEQNSIDQLLVNGGTISLGANEVLAASGSIINLTGGYIHYLGGWIQTTRLVGADGQTYSIGSADPLMTYVGIAGQATIKDARWGVTNTYTASLSVGGYYEPDYVQGGNAGTLSIEIDDGTAFGAAVPGAGAFVLDSTLLAQSVSGAQQVAAGTLPSNGSFSFTGFEPIEIGDPGVLSATSLAALLPPANFTMASPLLATSGSVYATANVISSQTLNDGNFANISLTNGNSSLSGSGAITEDAGTSLTVQPGGSISLTGGSNVTVNGSLTAHAGTIDVTTTPTIPASGFVSSVPGDIVIGSEAVLDVSGLFVNDSQLPVGQADGSVLTNGGTISLVADDGIHLVSGNPVTGSPPPRYIDLTGNITLAAGSLLDLEGGGHVLRNGQLRTTGNGAPTGAAGNLTLATYENLGQPPTTNGAPPTRGVLTVDGTIDALGMSGGGTLTLQAVALQIGGGAATTPSYAYYFDPTAWGVRGFDSFNLNSVLQAEVPTGATVRLTHENLLPNLEAIRLAPSGADPAAYSTVGSLTGTLLSPTNLSVTAGWEERANNFPSAPSGSDDAQVDAGAEIFADPGAKVSLSSYAMTSILGTVEAPGGTISLSVGGGAEGPIGPLYIGSSAVLDVSGTTLINPLAAPIRTPNGFVTPYTGQILAGGTITLTDHGSPILIAPGAVINVSGAANAFDVAQLGSDSLGGEVLSRQPVWSDAGQVNISFGSGVLFEGTLIGKPGAAQANGGTLQITGALAPDGGDGGALLVPDVAAAVAGSGATFNFASYVPHVVPFGTGGGLAIDPKLDDVMLVGVDTINGSGFSSLILNMPGSVGFAGPVSLTLGGSFVVNALGLAGVNLSNFPPPGANGTSLLVTAPYIAVNANNLSINGVFNAGFSLPGSSTPTGATLTLDATRQLDLSGFVFIQQVKQAILISSGDIRLMPAPYAPPGPGTQLLGELSTSGNLTLEAADIYPATDTAFLVYSSASNGTIAFGYPQGVAPSTTTPLSAGGTLLVDANTIIQNGEIEAPFGSIMLGLTGVSAASSATAIGTILNVGALGFVYPSAINTQAVTLGGGSVTSVSANGATIPFGSTVDQTTWIYNPQLNNPSWDAGVQQTAFTYPLTAAPQGVVSLGGTVVNFNSGAVINLDGGGDLSAQEWIPGTGGSRNVLVQFNTSYQNSTTGQQAPLYPDQRQIYAILPGYSSALAPYDATLAQPGLAAGASVYLAGGPGLAAGVYTLLPAQYATLPGAFRVVMNSGVTNPLLSQTVTLADGTMQMTGYLTNSLTGSRPSVTQQFQVQSTATWEKYSQYAITSANSFFPTYAAGNALGLPNVPANAGRLVLAAQSGLNLGGTVLGSPAPGGLGAQIDISGQYLDIVDSGTGTTAVNDGLLNLSAPGTSGTLPTGTTIAFAYTNAAGQVVAVSANDVFTVTGTGTLVVPTGVTATERIAVGGTLIANSQPVTLSSGQILTAGSSTNAVAVTSTGTDTVKISSSHSITLPAASTTKVTLASLSDTLTYNRSSGTGAATVTISSSSLFTVGGNSTNVTFSSATGLYSTTIYTTNQAVKGTAVGQTITWTIGTSTTSRSSGSFGAGGSLSYSGSTATATLAFATNGAGIANATYQLGNGVQVTALSASDLLTGTFTLSGSAPLSVASAAGTYSIATGTQLSSLSAGSAAATFTSASVDKLAYSSGSGAAIPGTTYLEVSAQQLSALGATSLLIGGTRSETPAGMQITPTANGVWVANDAKAPLAAPEVMLVATPAFQTTTVTLDRENATATLATPITGTGQVQFTSGSVVQALGAVAPGEPATIILGSSLANLPALSSALEVSQINGSSVSYGTLLQAYYTDMDAALGTLVRLSNGSPVTVQLPSAALLNPSPLTVTDDITTTNAVFTATLPSLSGVTGAAVQPGAELLGGNSLGFASTGNTRIEAGALLSGTNIAADSSQITFVGSGTPAGTNGTVITAATLVQLQNAANVNLQSTSTIAFQGNVALQMAGNAGSLTLGAGALTSDGGTISITAPTVMLDDEVGAPTQSFVAGTGSLAVNAGELIFGVGAKTLQGFGSVSLEATQGVVGQGAGSMNFGSLPLTLQTPIMIADSSSDQTITTTAALSVVPLAGTAMTSNALGGAITLQGGTVTVSDPIEALAGNISLQSSAGDITVTGTGALIAHGFAKQFVDVMEYAPAGTITLSASQGTVNIESGAVVDFSGASGGGNGGSLSITTANSAAPVAIASNTLFGATAPGYSGSSFSLNTGGPVTLDALAQSLISAGVTGGISVESGQGDLSLSQTLTAQTVQLIANSGLVTVTGAINASGAAGGTIELFGSNGVTLIGSLIATASNPNQLGGTVEIGTSGSFNTSTGSYNTTGCGSNNGCGYENITASGAITLGANAVINVSGGTFDGETGGTVLFRAPLLEDGSVNVTLPASFAPNAGVIGARSATLEAYAVWSTADSTTGAQHFDGIIDPAGWYDRSGNLLPGTFTNAAGTVVATFNGSNLTLAQQAADLAQYYFAPNTPDTAHETFYGYVSGDNTAAQPGTLMSFIETPGFRPVPNSASIANLQETPGIELDSPITAAANSGNIKVLTNWNLGAQNASGVLVYRYNGAAPYITLRAGGNIAINASITDGFAEAAALGPTPLPPYTPVSYTSANGIYTSDAGTWILIEGPIPSNTYNTASNDQTTDAGLWSLSTISTGDLVFGSSPMLQPPAGISAASGGIGVASVTTPDGYYGAYEAYLAAYGNYFTNALQFNSGFFSSAGTPVPSNVAADLAAANAAYNSGNLTLTAYVKTYLPAYQTYVSDYDNWSFNISLVGTLPAAPSPPPIASLPPPASFPTGGLVFTRSPALVAPANSSSIGLTSVATTNAYYGAYQAYLPVYQYFYNNDLEQNGGNVGVDNSNFSAAGATAPANVTAALAAANAAYDPTNLANYRAYLTAYQTYATDYSVWAASQASVGTLPVSPLPPPSMAYVSPLPPAQNNPAPVASANNFSPVAAMSLAAETSSSYRIVAGADVSSADPLAVVSLPPATIGASTTGNVTLDDHTLFTVSPTGDQVIVVPTIVRTGSGSIDIAAAGNFALADPLAPGVVYTAGTPAQAASGGDDPSVALGAGAFQPAGSSTPHGIGVSTLLTSAVNAQGGGNLSLTVGGNITGIENVTDTLATTAVTPTGVSGNPNSFIGQLWEPWLLSNPNVPSVPWYVNFGSFDQGLMSVGGNVTVAAGGSISDLAVSLPTTAYLDSANVTHITGGGNLSVTAGGSIFSGDFYVGQGTGTITSGGAIASNFTYVPTDDPSHTYPVATLLAVQYGTIAVGAREAVDIGGVYDPTYLWAPHMGDIPNPPVASQGTASSTPVSLIPYVTSMSSTSGVSVQSTAGALTFNSLLAEGDMIGMGATGAGAGLLGDNAPAAFISSLLLPSSLNLVALQGGIDIDHGGGLYPSVTGTLSIIADQSVDLSVPLVTGLLYNQTGTPTDSIAMPFTAVGNVFGTTLGKLDYPVGTGILPTASAPALLPVWNMQPTQTNDPSLIQDSQVDPVHIYSLNGSIVDGVQVTSSDGKVWLAVYHAGTNVSSVPLQVGIGGTVDQLSLIPNAPAEIYAGQDILDLPFFGTNFTAADVTSIYAGRDIRYNIDGDQQSPAIELAGPGTLDLIAGRDLSFQSQRVIGATETGIRTIGNSIDSSANPILDSPAPVTATLYPYNTTTFLADFGNPYLPRGGASVNVLFGVGPSIDYAAFEAQFLNPATAVPFALNGTWQALDSSGNPTGLILTPAQNWAQFETLSPAQQQQIALYDFFAILNAVGLDYRNSSSPYYQQYSNGYEAINALFPAAFGYTTNSLGTVNGANQLVATGNLDTRGSTIQTQQGGNIAILGPGGRILVGSSGAAPAVNPASEGILTLESGNIDIFADRDVLVAQSRIMTEQGGHIWMWSSNGNIDAGQGAKTSVSAPPPLYACDIDWICKADIKGAVSGAGIATLQSLPGVPVGNANLITPRGTVNAGAAGIRVSGNLNIDALIVANAFNIQVQGTTTGIPTAVAPNIGSLTSASNAAGQAAAAATAAARQARSGPVPQELPSIITVEVVGYGGGDNHEPQRPEEERRKKPGRQSERQDPTSAYQILGVGDLSDAETKALIEERRGLMER